MEIFLVCSYRRLRRDPRKARLVLVNQRTFEIPNVMHLDPVFWVGLKSAHLVPTDPDRYSRLILGSSGPALSQKDFFNSMIVELQPVYGKRDRLAELIANFYDPIDRTVVHKKLCIEFDSNLRRKYDKTLGYYISDISETKLGEKMYFQPDSIIPVQIGYKSGQEDMQSLRSVFSGLEYSEMYDRWRPHHGSRIEQWFAPETNEDLRILMIASKSVAKTIDWEVNFPKVETIVRNKFERAISLFLVFVEPLLKIESSLAVLDLLHPIEKYFRSVEAVHQRIKDQAYVIGHLKSLLNPGVSGLLHKLWTLRKKNMIQLAKSALEENNTDLNKLLDRYQAKPPEDDKQSANYKLKYLIYHEFQHKFRDSYAEDRFKHFDWDMRSQPHFNLSDPPSIRPYLFSRGQYQLVFHRNQLDILQTASPDHLLGHKVASWEFDSVAAQKAVVYNEWHLTGSVALRVLFHESSWRHLFVRLKFPSLSFPEVVEHREICQTTSIADNRINVSTLKKNSAIVIYGDQKGRFPCLYYEIGPTGLPSSYSKIDLKSVLGDPMAIKEMGIYFLRGKQKSLLIAYLVYGHLQMGCYELDFAQSKAVEVYKNKFQFYRETHRHHSEVENWLARPLFVVSSGKLFVLAQVGTRHGVANFLLIYCHKRGFTQIEHRTNCYHEIRGTFMQVYCSGNSYLREQYLIRKEASSIKTQKYNLLRVQVRY